MTEMEEQFTRVEQEAVAHVLYNIAHADYTNHTKENECIKSCLAELGFEDKDFVPKQKSELPSKIYETIRQMPIEKKRVLSRMMTQVSRSDGNFGSLERAFVIEILELCDVPFVHK